ncbi:MAG: hypothetical protein FJ109_05560 [Deltaproteobacteria bacterium]|nr:hypothetical protein [Deltaproteobacteria bacterium]
MFPFLPDGSLLFFEAPLALHVGDIVLTEEDGRWLAHRVIGLEANHVITCGDWNRTSDPPVPRDRVLGRCTQIRRKGVDIHLDLLCVRLFSRLLAAILTTAKSRL